MFNHRDKVVSRPLDLDLSLALRAFDVVVMRDFASFGGFFIGDPF